MPPQLGRGFTDDEGERGKNHEVILGEGLWRRLFGSKQALGESVTIDGVPHTVVGVMPADFVFIDSS